MPSAHVQTAFANNAALNPTTLSVTLTLTAGNDVVVTLLLYFTNSTPTQTAGDTLTNRINRTTGGVIQKQYNAHAVAGGSTTFTFTFSSTQRAAMFVEEASGLSGAFDVSGIGTNQTGTNTYPTGTATPTGADFCVAALNLEGGGSNTGLSADSGYTVPTNGDQIAAGGPDSMKAALAYLSTSGAAGMTFGLTTVTDGEAIVGCYKDAVATSATYPQLERGIRGFERGLATGMYRRMTTPRWARRDSGVLVPVYEGAH